MSINYTPSQASQLDFFIKTDCDHLNNDSSTTVQIFDSFNRNINGHEVIWVVEGEEWKALAPKLAEWAERNLKGKVRMNVSLVGDSKFTTIIVDCSRKSETKKVLEACNDITLTHREEEALKNADGVDVIGSFDMNSEDTITVFRNTKLSCDRVNSVEVPSQVIRQFCRELTVWAGDRNIKMVIDVTKGDDGFHTVEVFIVHLSQEQNMVTKTTNMADRYTVKFKVVTKTEVKPRVAEITIRDFTGSHVVKCFHIRINGADVFFDHMNRVVRVNKLPIKQVSGSPNHWQWKLNEALATYMNSTKPEVSFTA